MIPDIITPVSENLFLSKWLDIDLKIKHDDLFPFVGGGNKARKIKYILNDAERKGSNALVSAGAANSNHARVVAIAGARNGWSVKLIIHDDEDYSKGNLLLMKMSGADLVFVDHADVSDAMDQAMEDLRNDGFEPYYIWGGGHNIYGMLAYYEAVKEVESQLKDWNPDYVIHASGTGGTQTGLHVGFEELYSDTKVIGISVAREKGRGERIVEEGVKDLRKYLGIYNKRNEVIFLDDWTKDGYGSIYPNLVEGIKKASKYGFITDPVYTGKALLALSEMCSDKTIEPNSKVLFWHTGGLANLYNEYQSFT